MAGVAGGHPEPEAVGVPSLAAWAGHTTAGAAWAASVRHELWEGMIREVEEETGGVCLPIPEGDEEQAVMPPSPAPDIMPTPCADLVSPAPSASVAGEVDPTKVVTQEATEVVTWDATEVVTQDATKVVTQDATKDSRLERRPSSEPIADAMAAIGYVAEPMEGEDDAETEGTESGLLYAISFG